MKITICKSMLMIMIAINAIRTPTTKAVPLIQAVDKGKPVRQLQPQ